MSHKQDVRYAVYTSWESEVIFTMLYFSMLKVEPKASDMLGKGSAMGMLFVFYD